jgi:Fe-S cluster assembly protein SufB
LRRRDTPGSRDTEETKRPPSRSHNPFIGAITYVIFEGEEPVPPKVDVVTEDYRERYGFCDPVESYAVQGLKGLSERVVQEIVRIHDEPAWMEQIRMKALRHFLDRKPPDWAPELGAIDYQGFYYYARPTDKAAESWDQLPEYIRRTYDKLGISEAEKKFLAGVGAVYESEAVYHSIQGELAKQGVVFTDTVTALKEYPDIMKRYFGTVVPYQDNYIAALQTAVWSAGSFVHVPEGVKVTTPLQAYFRINERNMGQFERTLIIGEPYSEVTYIEGCLPATEMVSQGHTLNQIQSIAVNEEVVTHSGRKQTVTDTYIHPHEGVMLTIVPQSSANAFRLTAEHPVLAIRRSKVVVRKSRHNWLPEASTSKLLEAVPEFIEAGKLEVGDFVVYVAPSEEKDDPELSDDILKILGTYLAEGSISYNKSLRRDVLEFSFGDSESEGRFAHELVDLIHSQGDHASLHRAHGRYYCVNTYSKKLIELCRTNCEVGAPTKSLSERIMLLPAPRQMILLSYYLRGDGNRYEKKADRSTMIRASTASRTLAFQLQEILARARIFANMNIRKGAQDMIGERRMARRDQYIIEYTENKKWSAVRRRGNHFFVPIREIRSEPFNGDVYNLGVSGDESYLVKGFAVHNCSAPIYSSQSLHSAIVEIIARKGSFVKYTTLQNWSKDVLNLVTKRAHAHEDATVSWVDFNGGSKLTRKYPSIYLLGPRSKADIISVAYAGAGQVQDTGGKAIHLAKDTTSRIISRSVSKDGGHTAYRGLLHIAKGAKNAKSTVRCVTPDTLILGDNKPIVEYGAGDHAVGASGENTVTRTYANDFDGLMVRIRAVGMMPIDVTPEHPILTSRSRVVYPCVMRNGKHSHTMKIELGGPAWKPASQLLAKHSSADGDYVLMPRLKGSVSARWLDLASFAKNQRGLHVMTRKGHASVFPLNSDTAWAIGMYVAEGYASQGKLKFGLNSGETNLVRRITSIFTGLGYKAGTYSSKKENGAEVVVFAEVLSRAFESWCGKGAPNKRIPDFILLHRDSGIVDSFLAGYVAGDGTLTTNCVGRKNVIHIVTTSKLLAMQTQLLGARRGLFFRITRASRADNVQGRKVKIHEKYDVRCSTDAAVQARMDDRFLYVPVRKIERARYVGPVYNLETSDHTYLISNAVSHNCDALLIDPRSTTATYPYMEIQEDDATVTHEASVGKVGEEQLFYLMSRGISEGDALSMVVNGFLEPFAKELPMTYAVEFNRLMSIEMTNAVG